MKNNIAFWRIYRNLSQARLAEMIPMPPSTLNRIESGEIAAFEKYRKKLAIALRCAPEDLDGDKPEVQTIPVTGIVQRKNYVIDLPAADQDKVEFIPGLPPQSEAIKIRCTHLIPYHGNGKILYFDRKPEKNPKLFLGRECILELDIKRRGDKVLAWISEGSKKDRYLIHTYNSGPLKEVKIKAAYPILYSKNP